MAKTAITIGRVRPYPTGTKVEYHDYRPLSVRVINAIRRMLGI